MSIEGLNGFREKVATDAAIDSTLRGYMSADGVYDVDAAVALGRQNGFDFTAEEVLASLRDGEGELSDFELELVSAGTSGDTNNNKGTQG